MGLTDQDIAQIIHKARQEIFGDNHAAKPSETTAKTVVLVPCVVPSPQKAVSYIKEKYGEASLIIFLSDMRFDTDGLNHQTLSAETQKRELADMLVKAERIVLISPEISMLSRLNAGQDERFLEGLLLRSLLWGKALDLLLDFDPPKFKRGTFFERIVDAIDGLTSMGVTVSVFEPIEKTGQKIASLITERDIVDAKHSGIKTIVCQKEAIVTPLAVDTAKEFNINIEYR